MDIQSYKANEPKASKLGKAGSFLVKSSVDRPLLIMIILLLCYGSVMVFSASYAYAYARYDDSAYFIRRQLLWVAFGLLAMFVASIIPYKIYQRFTPAIFGGSLLLLVLVLVIGVAEDEAKRWIAFGPISFQPSEIMKFALVLMIAWWAHKYRKSIVQRDGSMITYFKSFAVGTVIPVLLVAIACVLIMLENHLSGTIIVFAIGVSVIWVGGGKKSVYIIGLVALAIVIYVIYFQPEILKNFLSDYQYKRIDMWLNPDKYDAQDDTWQTIQGLIAVGSGGIFGRGIGNSLQKHLFVSQPQNDFIFSIICEELGFVGALTLIALYIAFVVRCLQIAKRAPDVFSSLTVIGIAAHVAFQAVLNMMVVTSILPNTGISLPFFSYGGSSLIFLMIEMGIVLSISRFSRIQK